MEENEEESLKERLWRVIFEAETPMGKAFDVVLLWAIVLSVVAVMLESVASIDAKYHTTLKAFEWGFTILFTIEYLLRIFLVRHPLKYMRSFFGIVDLLSCIPTYLVYVAALRYHVVVRSPHRLSLHNPRRRSRPNSCIPEETSGATPHRLATLVPDGEYASPYQ